MIRDNFQEYVINGIQVCLQLDTKTHKWKIYIGPRVTPNEWKYKEPDLVMTNKTGRAVSDFIKAVYQHSQNQREISTQEKTAIV